MSKNSELLLGTSPHYISSPFGNRTHPVTGELESFHNGNDYATYKKKPPILCPFDGGEVLRVGKDRFGALFFYVGFQVLGHVGMGYHCDSITAKKGQKVKCGDILGYVGNTGRSSGEHLHWSWIVWNDKALSYYEADYEDFELYETEVEDVTEDRVREIIREVLAGEGKPVSDWAEKDGTWEKAKKEGITDGTNPQGRPTREQVAAMILRSKNK